jgi:drug/metabolite transporter (DMT)-like permease
MRSILAVLGVGAVGFGISVGLQFVGTSLSSAAHAAVITSASPIFILLFGFLFLGEPATPRRIAALGIASLGVAAVLSPTAAGMAGGTTLGNLALIGAAVTWGLYSVLVKRASRDRPTTEVGFLAFLGGLAISLPLTAVEGVGIGPEARSPAILLGVVYLGLVSTALAMYLWNRSLALLEAGLVSILFFAQPVVGVALGAWLLGEVLGPSFWLGAGLISIGLVLSALPPRGNGRRATAESRSARSDPGGRLP